MKVVITGITGQDGSLMADYLLKNTNAQIFGVVRQLSVTNHANIEHLKNNPRVCLIDGDITDPHSMSGIVRTLQPEYFINFAANSFVGTSWKNPVHVFESNAMAVLHQLEAIRQFSPTTRYYQAGSSEEFGDVQYYPQDEAHPLRPRSPYGASKCSARHLVKVYRESYGLYAVCGWLFNHEGIRRGEQFVSRKITKQIAKIKYALEHDTAFAPLILGNLEAKRDWSDAEDFVDGVWRMLNQDRYNEKLNIEKHNEWYRLGDEEYNTKQMTEWLSSRIKDYVLASGETHTIREFIEMAFRVAEIDICPAPTQEAPTDKEPVVLAYVFGDKSACTKGKNGQPVVLISKDFYRPAEVNVLLGSSKLAREELGWKPQSSFHDLVKKMVFHDLHLISA